MNKRCGIISIILFLFFICPMYCTGCSVSAEKKKTEEFTDYIIENRNGDQKEGDVRLTEYLGYPLASFDFYNVDTMDEIDNIISSANAFMSNNPDYFLSKEDYLIGLHFYKKKDLGGSSAGNFIANDYTGKIIKGPCNEIISFSLSSEGGFAVGDGYLSNCEKMFSSIQIMTISEGRIDKKEVFNGFDNLREVIVDCHDAEDPEIISELNDLGNGIDFIDKVSYEERLYAELQTGFEE